MTEDEARELVGRHIGDEKEADLTVRAVLFVANRVEMAKDLCDKLFGQNVAEVEEVYSMHDYLIRETSAQVLLMAGEKAVNQLKAAQAREKSEPDGDLN
jgi:hypothetical protein